MAKKKYMGYYYTTCKNIDGMYVWRIRNKKGEILMLSDDCFGSKEDAERDAEEQISEHYY